MSKLRNELINVPIVVTSAPDYDISCFPRLGKLVLMSNLKNCEHLKGTDEDRPVIKFDNGGFINLRAGIKLEVVGTE